MHGEDRRARERASETSPDQPDPAQGSSRPIVALRVGLGVIWSLNLAFIADPSNVFFASFSSVAQGFGSTTLGGPGLATFVATHSAWFALAVALTTAYLAAAFLLGVSVRTACMVGLVFNATLLLTQFGQIVVIPGGTDVGPQPLYILAYVVLLSSGAVPATRWSLQAWIGRAPAHEVSDGPRSAVSGPTADVRVAP